MVGGLVSGVFSMMGAAAQAKAYKQQAAAERQAAEYNAKLQEQAAMEQRAVAQRKALEGREKKEVTIGNLQARAAASGGGASINDPSVIKLAGDIEEKGEYAALGDMYSGEAKGRSLENQANLDRYVGETKARASEAKAKAAIIGGIGSAVGGLFGKFG
jgi:type II secretory pathway pseudopilin PulG